MYVNMNITINEDLSRYWFYSNYMLYYQPVYQGCIRGVSVETSKADHLHIAISFGTYTAMWLAMP